MTQAPTASSGTTAQPQPAAETVHLRRFIEKQPACILRVGLDAMLLAVNEAALGLVGAEQLAQVLGTKLTRFITPRQQDEWQEFASRVKDGASASIECDLTDMGGTRRTILLQGVPLLDHPDGVPSMILSARDISAPRRLEMALREREVNRELEDLQRQLQHGLVERQHLATSLTEREDSRQQLLADHAAEQARLRQTLTEQHKMALLLKEQESRQLLDSLRSDLEQALAERQRLAATLAEQEAEQQRRAAAQAADRAQLQQSLADEHQLALILKEREARDLVESLRVELEKSLAERQELAAAFDEREARHQQAVSEHVAAREQLERILEEERDLLRKEQEGRQLLGSVKQQLETLQIERQQLADTLAELQSNHQSAAAEHHAERERLERTLEEERGLLRKEQEGRQLLGAVKEQLETLQIERQQLADTLAELQSNHQRAAAEHHAERERLQQILAEQRELLAKEREGRQALEGLQGSLQQAQAERERLEASLVEREAQHQRVVAEQMAEHAQRQRMADEQHRMLLAKEQETERLLDGVRTELQQAQDDRLRLVGLLDDREADHQRLLSEQSDARADAERKLAAAVRNHTEVEQSIASLRVELQSVDENARHLEWLAAAGRAAREIGRELQTVVEAVDARTRHLLAESSLGDDERHVIESLRGDAIGAASLVRQIVHAGEGSEAKDSADRSSAPQQQPSSEGDPQW
ncbi:MAG TPA: PAS domain-containing protein [Vicinamibacterales bacterium]|nr:PAS domain-containing protein [Vicinamibacterales bacterium]